MKKILAIFMTLFVILLVGCKDNDNYFPAITTNLSGTEWISTSEWSWDDYTRRDTITLKFLTPTIFKRMTVTYYNLEKGGVFFLSRAVRLLSNH